MRVALCINLGDYVVDPEVEAKPAAAGRWSAGAVVEEVTLPWRASVVPAAWAHFGAIFGGASACWPTGPASCSCPTPGRSPGGRGSATPSRSAGLVAEASLYAPLGDCSSTTTCCCARRSRPRGSSQATTIWPTVASTARPGGTTSS